MISNTLFQSIQEASSQYRTANAQQRATQDGPSPDEDDSGVAILPEAEDTDTPVADEIYANSFYVVFKVTSGNSFLGSRTASGCVRRKSQTT